jgi:hypothetical protein
MQDRNAAAVKLMEYCVQVQRRIIGANHPRGLKCYTLLASWQAERMDMGAKP